VFDRTCLEIGADAQKSRLAMVQFG